mmetsp:Transcript_13177/g.20517  ORF Transcript_13177/g.20517 Transcript_13177/m.20517 type:complete len:139 (+) Transcript_13177:896-1312(+)
MMQETVDAAEAEYDQFQQEVNEEIGFEKFKAASDCLSAINKRQVSELKSLTNPPAGVIQAMQILVLQINGQWLEKWASIQKEFSNINAFFQALSDYDFKFVDSQIFSIVEEALATPQLSEKSIKAKSLAAWGLLLYLK